MKFVMNHSYKFLAPNIAFVCSFMMLSVMVFIEWTNFVMLIYVTDLFEFIRDFTALIIISELDTLLYSILKNEILKEIINSSKFQSMALSISRTTSVRDMNFNRTKAINNDILLEAIANKGVTLSGFNID